jgi:TFIIF-interacting CTD phosphatase-like protein
MSEECRMNIILDLDNTIINALSDSDRKKLSSDFSSKFKYRDMIPFFRIYARPHIEEFLDYLFSNYNVAVMTAAEKDYALFIIDNFILTKPERKLEFVFFRYQVELSREVYGGVKDLRVIWDLFNINGFSQQNTIIVDDLDMVYETNPHNTLRIPGFFVVDEDKGTVNYDSINDTALLDIMKQLDYLRGVYVSNICKGLDKAILDFSIISKKEEKPSEEKQLEQAKEEVKKEVEDHHEGEHHEEDHHEEEPANEEI